jgi:hypothetical protein
MLLLAGSKVPSSNNDYAVLSRCLLVQSRINSDRNEPSMRVFEGATFIEINYTIDIPLLSSRC